MVAQKALKKIKQNGSHTNNEKGQALTEFVMIFVVFLFIILAHFQLSMNYVASSYINYASYMAARTNLVAGEDRARFVAEHMVGTPGNSYFGPFARIEDIKVSPEGVNIEYTSPIYVPLIRFPQNPDVENGGKGLKMKAFTNMGQEPHNCEGVINDNGC